MKLESILQLMEAQLDALLEAPLDMPEGSDIEEQLSLIIQRLEAAKRALGIANKLQTPEDRKYHKSRVMVFLNQLRGLFDRTTKQLLASISDGPAPTPASQPLPDVR